MNYRVSSVKTVLEVTSTKLTKSCHLLQARVEVARRSATRLLVHQSSFVGDKIRPRANLHSLTHSLIAETFTKDQAGGIGR